MTAAEPIYALAVEIYDACWQGEPVHPRHFKTCGKVIIYESPCRQVCVNFTGEDWCCRIYNRDCGPMSFAGSHSEVIECVNRLPDYAKAKTIKSHPTA